MKKPSGFIFWGFFKKGVILNRNNEISKEELELINLIKTIDKEVKSTFKDININDVDILQRDRGFQYTSYMFKNMTKDITHSMSRLGHCPDKSLIDLF